MSITIGHTEIFVKDVQKAKDFYIDVLGFEVITIQHEKFVWLKLGDKMILLRPGENNLKSETYQKTNKAIVLYTNDLDKSVKDLTKRGLEFKGTDGSEKCLTFTDLDGNWFQLVNPDAH